MILLQSKDSLLYKLSIPLFTYVLSVSVKARRTSIVANIYVLWIFVFCQQQELSSKVFAHLCDVVDDNKQFYDEKIHQISKLIILEGKS